jgi:putative tryptophan/tyrosine transport system substrate-binding protein
VKRRALLRLLGGATLAWSPRLGAETADRLKRIGFLGGGSVGDAEWQARLAAFRQRLQELAWVEEGDIRIEVRLVGEGYEAAAVHARELVGLSPAAIVTTGIVPTSAVLRETRAVPVVFSFVADPVGQGVVESLARPSGNATGFTSYDPAMGGKWLQTLKEVAPTVARVGVLAHPQRTWSVYRTAIEAAARLLALDAVDVPLDDVDALEPALAALGGPGRVGLVVVADGFNIRHRDRIVALAGSYRLPAIYPYAFFATAGGLMSYGVDGREHVRQAASYVDRILRGARPADLPVQTPTKFEFVVNLKTAKTLGITMPQALLLRADEVIE